MDPSIPSIARVYDASLDGKDNFEADRAVWRRILEVAPHQGKMSRLNREWLIRVVGWLASEGRIEQFLDLGSGLPTQENTHQVARRRNRDSKVLYVDNDLAVLAYGRALLEQDDDVRVLDADFTKPDELLNQEFVTRFLDFEDPIGLMQCGTLHHVPDEDDPAGLMRTYIDALPSGSYVVISHFWNPGDENPELADYARDMETRFADNFGLGSGWFRSRAEIEAMFCGLELMPPGLVELHQWWPLGPRLEDPYPEERLILGGVGKKP